MVYDFIMGWFVCISEVRFIHLILLSLMPVCTDRCDVDGVIKFLMGKSASRLLFCWVIYSYSLVFSIILGDIWLGNKFSINNFYISR